MAVTTKSTNVLHTFLFSLLLGPKDGCKTFLWKISTLLQDYTSHKITSLDPILSLWILLSLQFTLILHILTHLLQDSQVTSFSSYLILSHSNDYTKGLDWEKIYLALIILYLQMITTVYKHFQGFTVQQTVLTWILWSSCHTGLGCKLSHHSLLNALSLLTPCWLWFTNLHWCVADCPGNASLKVPPLLWACQLLQMYYHDVA
jgi:hypothetical protein